MKPTSNDEHVDGMLRELLRGVADPEPANLPLFALRKAQQPVRARPELMAVSRCRRIQCWLAGLVGCTLVVLLLFVLNAGESGEWSGVESAASSVFPETDAVNLTALVQADESSYAIIGLLLAIAFVTLAANAISLCRISAVSWEIQIH